MYTEREIRYCISDAFRKSPVTVHAWLAYKADERECGGSDGKKTPRQVETPPPVNEPYASGTGSIEASAEPV